CGCFVVARQSKQRRAAENVEPCGSEQPIQPIGLVLPSRNGLGAPALIHQRTPPDLERWAGYRPWADRLAQPPAIFGRGRGKAEAQTRKPVDLAKGAQNDGASLGQM